VVMSCLTTTLFNMQTNSKREQKRL